MYDEKELKKNYLSLAIIGAGMVISVIIYAVVGEVIAKQNAPFSGFVKGFDQIDTLRYILLAVSVVILGVAGVARKALLSDKLSKFMVKPNAQSTGGGPVFAQFNSAHVIVFALCESVAIYGMVLFLIAGSRFDLYLFIAISLAGYAVYFPRYSQLKAWALKREGGAEAGAEEKTHDRYTYDQKAGRYRR
jgi:F0F1-type ATP synthase membrane subunit c/vacuolar-type H+-ATPase subunit K